jgi:nucleotide-binding universal stress UspA family protein
MQRFKNILLYSSVEDDGAVIQRAIKLAQANGAKLTLIDVIRPMPSAMGFKTEEQAEDVQQLISAEHHEQLRRLAGKFAESGVTIQTIVKVGDPAVEIVRAVCQRRHDLVIKSADGLSSVGRLFGSVARSLMRLCPCPVWVLKPEIHGEFDTVLAAVDLDAEDNKHQDLNRHIVSLAASIASPQHARLHIVCSWNLWMEASLRRHAGNDEINMLVQARQDKLSEAMDGLLKDTGLVADQVSIHLKRGSPTQVIPLTVDKIEADLLVMGTVCRTGVAGFLIGNTAESILADLTCSVLTLKPDGFRSPVELTDPNSSVEPWEMPPSLV